MLSIDNLGYRFADKDLLQGISLSLSPGHLYGLLGPNGSGKSTLLRTIAGIWQPTAGSVSWQGVPLHTRPRRELSQIVSLVPQSPAIAFEFSVAEFVEMGCYPNAYAGASRQRVQKALETVDGWHLRDRTVCSLSQGERQRIYIGRALVVESPVLLLDEPTASLDIRHQLEIWELLCKLRQQGKIVIVAIHDFDVSAQLCDAVALLHQGRCIAQGAFKECLTSENLCEVFGVEALPAGAMRMAFRLPRCRVSNVFDS